MASGTEPKNWLADHGPKELELLFRAIVFHSSAPVLIADDEGHYRNASVGASKVLGLPRDQIVGRQIDDFVAPNFKPKLSELWKAFLTQGKQEGVLELVDQKGVSRQVAFTAK